MARKFNSGEFIPKNPQKYLGNRNPVYRSSWERLFMIKLDSHPFVIKWLSEGIAIPYVNPVEKTMRNYYPDFFIIYMDKKGKIHKEIIEIKPLRESLLEKAKTKKDILATYVNMAKWKAALKYSHDIGATFRVMTEKNLFQKY